jgi:hypothetical protein
MPPTEKLLCLEKYEVPNSENLVPNISKLVPKYWWMFEVDEIMWGGNFVDVYSSVVLRNVLYVYWFLVYVKTRDQKKISSSISRICILFMYPLGGRITLIFILFPSKCKFLLVLRWFVFPLVNACGHGFEQNRLKKKTLVAY